MLGCPCLHLHGKAHLITVIGFNAPLVGTGATEGENTSVKFQIIRHLIIKGNCFSRGVILRCIRLVCRVFPASDGKREKCKQYKAPCDTFFIPVLLVSRKQCSFIIYIISSIVNLLIQFKQVKSEILAPVLHFLHV